MRRLSGHAHGIADKDHGLQRHPVDRGASCNVALNVRPVCDGERALAGDDELNPAPAAALKHLILLSELAEISESLVAFSVLQQFVELGEILRVV